LSGVVRIKEPDNAVLVWKVAWLCSFKPIVGLDGMNCSGLYGEFTDYIFTG